MKTTKVALWALFTFGFLYVASNFTAQNSDPTSIQLFSWISPPYPKWQIILTAVFLGAIAATLFFIIEFIVLETRLIRLRRANQKLERALAALQAAPVNGAHAGNAPAQISREPSPRFDEDV